MQSFPSDILSNIRVHLEEEKKKLVARIEELSKQDPFTDPDRGIDNAASDTEANEESSHDRFSAMVDESKAKVSDIDDALVRIGDGTYGFCTACHEMIDTDRLSVLPMATLCKFCEDTKKKK
jgi:RNA polymerase-binding transcription factor DksA